MKLLAYTLLSITSFSVSLVYSYTNQFFPSLIQLYRNNITFLSLLNLILLSLFYTFKIITNIFIGRLRIIEIEHLYENIWFCLSETMLSMTIFREDFGVEFVLLFSVLLLVKSLHWVSRDRVEFMEQSIENRSIKVFMLLVLLLAVDVYALYSSLQYKLPSMIILFIFEYSILVVSVLTLLVRYYLNYYHLEWDRKSQVEFYLELVSDIIKLVAYLVFFVLLLNFYGLPIHLIRDLYMTTRSLVDRIKQLYQYRRIELQDATEEEIQRDPTCIICREDIQTGKRLSCGHVFHERCLRSWLERQSSCPTCRCEVGGGTNAGGDRAVDGGVQAQAQPRVEEQRQQQQQPDQQPQQQQPIVQTTAATAATNEILIPLFTPQAALVQLNHQTEQQLLQRLQLLQQIQDEINEDIVKVVRKLSELGVLAGGQAQEQRLANE